MTGNSSGTRAGWGRGGGSQTARSARSVAGAQSMNSGRDNRGRAGAGAGKHGSSGSRTDRNHTVISTGPKSNNMLQRYYQTGSLGSRQGWRGTRVVSGILNIELGGHGSGRGGDTSTIPKAVYGQKVWGKGKRGVGGALSQTTATELIDTLVPLSPFPPFFPSLDV